MYIRAWRGTGAIEFSETEHGTPGRWVSSNVNEIDDIIETLKEVKSYIEGQEDYRSFEVPNAG